MKKVFTYSLVLQLAVICIFSYAQEKTFVLKLKNNASIDRIDAYVQIDFANLVKKHKGLTQDGFILKDGGKEIPFQILPAEGKKKELCFVIDIKSRETKKITCIYGGNTAPGKFKNRTYAELAVKKNGRPDGKKVRGAEYENIQFSRVPSWHTDHDGLYKYEGPGWESERVGYRFYLDWRNATDIFGKKVAELVLKNVGIKDTIADNNESFHTMQPWGMDIFKVGNSLGVGSFGMWMNDKVNMVSKTDSITCAITANGPVLSRIKTNYYGWLVGDRKYDAESELTIAAGSRLTKNSIKISAYAGNIVTGLAKYAGTNFIKGEAATGWSYIALYGRQSLADDNLGIALFYKVKDLIGSGDDALSYYVMLKPAGGNAEYYFGAAWEKEAGGIKSESEFKKYLEHIISELNNPVSVE